MPNWVEKWDSDTVVTESVGPCWRCGKDTHCIDLNFNGRLCPPCYDPAWEEYFNA